MHGFARREGECADLDGYALLTAMQVIRGWVGSWFVVDRDVVTPALSCRVTGSCQVPECVDVWVAKVGLRA